MNRPAIQFDSNQQYLRLQTHYVLMESGLTNGEYPRQEFVAAIDGVVTDCIENFWLKDTIEAEKLILKNEAVQCNLVKISGYTSDRTKIMHKLENDHYFLLAKRLLDRKH